ncbi:hypothetical protein JHD49_08080 [Sulfurimonas sp. SAG-AH-194-C21]|nr:hypothetical protein [Sulfurimonas sp. SAG-AH-194-C21]MDF1883891.1 hypothetical protein [Sulfurimonas sp. SAG-AH-194-C21]
MMTQLRTLLLKYPQTSLIFFITLSYLYFMLDMYLPTTGDQKTYIAQALEMHRDGHWFMQTLFNEPDYYKGPLHFIFLRVGFILFGTHSMFALVYMNFFGLILLAILLFKFLRTSLNDTGWAFFYALSVVLSVGVYSHSFASQMEAELVILYGITLYLLDKADRDTSLTNLLLLWAVIGLVGWLKSPAYSLFLGLSVLLYWVLTSQIKTRAVEYKNYTAIAFGIAVGIAGYLPILIYDGDTFINTYILRESLSKGANGVPWTTAFFPIFTYFLAPFMFVAIFSYGLSLYKTLFKKADVLNDEERRLIKLGIALSAPTLLFFTFHPYRGDIYALPIVSATMLMAYIFFRAYLKEYEGVYIFLMRLSSYVLSLVPLLVIALYLRLSPMPEWWSPLLFPLALFTLVFTLLFVHRESKKVLKESPLMLSLAFIPLLLTLSLMLQSFAKGEIKGLKEYVKLNHITKPLGDYNLYKSYWNQYGALNFWAGVDVIGLFTQEELALFIKSGGSVIVEGDNRLKEFEQNLPQGLSMNDFDIYLWKRWLTHGKGPNGESKFVQYFKSKNISDIQKNYYILVLNNNSTQ